MIPKRDRLAFGIDFPSKAFDLALKVRPLVLPEGIIKSGFPTREKMVKEDLKRATVLENWGGDAAQALATKLRGIGEFPNLASARWMRTFQMKIGGEVLRTLAAYQDHEIFFVTLINKNWHTVSVSWTKPTQRRSGTALSIISLVWVLPPMTASYMLDSWRAQSQLPYVSASLSRLVYSQDS